jgi:hypothetical protein
MKVRRKVLSALLVSAVLVLAATPALATPEVHQRPEEPQAVAGPSEPFACTGYDLMATWVSAAGNRYTTNGNVCLYNFNDGTLYKGAVARFRCYRNGEPYGGGGFGCRWAFNSVTQHKAAAGNWVTNFVTSDNWVLPGATTFTQDSGRAWGTAAQPVYAGVDCRALTRSTQSSYHRVRFKVADGTEHVVNMSPNPHIGSAANDCPLQ